MSDSKRALEGVDAFENATRSLKDELVDPEDYGETPAMHKSVLSRKDSVRWDHSGIGPQGARTDRVMGAIPGMAGPSQTKIGSAQLDLLLAKARIKEAQRQKEALFGKALGVAAKKGIGIAGKGLATVGKGMAGGAGKAMQGVGNSARNMWGARNAFVRGGGLRGATHRMGRDLNNIGFDNAVVNRMAKVNPNASQNRMLDVAGMGYGTYSDASKWAQ